MTVRLPSTTHPDTRSGRETWVRATVDALRGLVTSIQGFLPLTGGTLTGDLSVPDEAYGVAWNGSLEVPTKNALYDKIETISGGGVSDGDKGDIVVSGSGTVWSFDTGVVTAAAKTVLDDASTSAMLTTLGAQPLDGTLTALAGASWSAGTQALTLTAADTVTLKTVGSASGNILDKAAGDALYQPLDTDLTSIAGLTFSQGDLIYRDGSQLQRLAAGTSGQVLKTNGSGSNPAWMTPALVFVGSYTPSAVSSLDIENFASLSNCNSIIIDIEYLTVSADSIGITAQFKLNGAYKTSTYKWTRHNHFAATTVSDNGSASDSSISIFLTGAGGMGNQSGEGGSGIIELLNPFDTAGQKRLVYRVDYIDDQGTPRLAHANGSGCYSGTDFASALAGVRLATSSGTMSGKIHVYARCYA